MEGAFRIVGWDGRVTRVDTIDALFGLGLWRWGM